MQYAIHITICNNHKRHIHLEYTERTQDKRHIHLEYTERTQGKRRQIQKEQPVHVPADLALTLKVGYRLSAPSVRPRKPEAFQNRTVKGTSWGCSGLRSHVWWAEAGEAHLQGRESTVASCTHGGEGATPMQDGAEGAGHRGRGPLPTPSLCPVGGGHGDKDTGSSCAPTAAQDPGRLGITSTQRHTRHFPRSDRERN